MMPVAWSPDWGLRSGYENRRLTNICRIGIIIKAKRKFFCDTIKLISIRGACEPKYAAIAAAKAVAVLHIFLALPPGKTVCS